MRQAVLKAADLKKSFVTRGERVEALKGVSLSIDAGEVLAFLGPNGAGKTTTIRILTGLVRQDSGTVLIDGRDPAHEVEALKVIGTVLEGNRRGAELLERFGLAAKERAPVQALSRGMQQKVALAVALVHRPRLLLLDEPTRHRRLCRLDPGASQLDQNDLQKEAQVGALQQVFLSSYGPTRVFVARTVADMLLTSVITLAVLLAILLLTGRRLAFPAVALLPVVAILLGSFGLAFLMGALALWLKRIQQLIQLGQFVLLFLVMTPFETWAGFAGTAQLALPIAPGAGCCAILWREAGN